MRILITNDDGVAAPGIKALAKRLSEEHEVVVVAPAVEQSGKGFGVTFLSPLFVRPYTIEGVDVPAYAVEGTPADCAKIGMEELAGFLPDMVVSGINSGSNLGMDTFPSGTVNAAIAAIHRGIPAIASSLCGKTEAYFEGVAEMTAQLVRYAEKYPAPKNVLLSLNAPDIPTEQIKGIRLAPLAPVGYSCTYDRRTNPEGDRTYYWTIAHFHWRNHSDTPHTDGEWITDGYATVTPICVDTTAYDYMEQMRKHPFFQEEHHGKQQ